MRGPGHWRLWGTVGVMTVAVVTGASGLASAAAAGPVSPNPASGTPHLRLKTSLDNVIRQIVQCGNTMYAVGGFTKILWNGATYTRHNVFSFQATAPYRIT